MLVVLPVAPGMRCAAYRGMRLGCVCMHVCVCVLDLQRAARQREEGTALFTVVKAGDCATFDLVLSSYRRLARHRPDAAFVSGVRRVCVWPVPNTVLQIVCVCVCVYRTTRCPTWVLP